MNPTPVASVNTPDVFSEPLQQRGAAAQPTHDEQLLIAAALAGGPQYVEECASLGIIFDAWQMDASYDPAGSGGSGEVYRGMRGSTAIAMKRIKGAKTAKEVTIRRFFRECKIWKTLDHRNVLEFYGVAFTKNSSFMISPFCENGTACNWLQLHRDQALRVLFEAAQGCHYLHNHTPDLIVHGDIKGDNILIADDGRALMSDFGLSKITNTQTSRGLKGLGSVPFMAPELFIEWGGSTGQVSEAETLVTKTLKSDVFAFGRTVLELLGGEIPFGFIANDLGIWAHAKSNPAPRPETPAARQWITHEIWSFIGEMTAIAPDSRPTMDVVKEKLQEFSAGGSGGVGNL